MELSCWPYHRKVIIDRGRVHRCWKVCFFHLNTSKLAFWLRSQTKLELWAHSGPWERFGYRGCDLVRLATGARRDQGWDRPAVGRAWLRVACHPVIIVPVCRLLGSWWQLLWAWYMWDRINSVKGTCERRVSCTCCRLQQWKLRISPFNSS